MCVLPDTMRGAAIIVNNSRGTAVNEWMLEWESITQAAREPRTGRSTVPLI
jgi:hypothetical protein